MTDVDLTHNMCIYIYIHIDFNVKDVHLSYMDLVINIIQLSKRWI